MLRLINYIIIIKVLSRNLFIIAASMLVCIGVALVYSDSILPFALSASISFILGLVFFILSRTQNEEGIIAKREAYLIVTISWLLISIFGSLPYLFSGAIPSFYDALFESVSGFTTTGSSILNDIESLPKSILFWRSLTHWIGGLGIIVLVIVIMPTLQMGGYHLFTLESSLQERIKPRIESIGKRLLLIYIVLTLMEVFFLTLGGMSLFDSFCHAFGTMATGGFSTKNKSIAEYSPYIQYIIMLFMLLAGTNFIIYYYLFKKEYKKLAKNEEVKFYLKTILLLGGIISFSLFISSNRTIETALREGYFQLISIVTCTGFSTSDYLLWPTPAVAILFFALFLGGSTGSTAGGIKMARYLILLKNIQRLMRKLISANAVIPIKINDEPIVENINHSIISFISFYFLIFILGSILLVLLKVDIKTASSAVATCMAGIGPGVGKVGPMNNFYHLSPLVKIILSFVMILGRLEIYTVLLIFTPSFWKK